MNNKQTKYKVLKNIKSFHVYKPNGELEKAKFARHLKQDYNIEISYELLLEKLKKDNI